MKNYLQIPLLFVCYILSISLAKSETFETPTWHELIEDSEFIILAKVLDEGKRSAGVEILKVYKGNLRVKDTVWIVNFTNYVDEPVLVLGKEYVIFMDQDKNDADDNYKAWWEDYWEIDRGGVNKMPKYFDALEEGKAYYNAGGNACNTLWIENDSVNYSFLIPTKYKGDYSYIDLPTFDKMLSLSVQNKSSKKFIKNLFRKLKKASSKQGRSLKSQYLMMLHLLRETSYHKIFDKLVNDKMSNTRFALAIYLGRIKTEKSRAILLQLLNDKNDWVQGEAIRQLAKQDPNFVGKILLEKLKETDTNGEINLINSTNNYPIQSKLEIIKAFGEIKYKPAIKTLTSLLETTNYDVFELLVNTLDSLESKAYVPYFKHHLEKETSHFVFFISSRIARDSLTECLSDLKKYISEHDRNQSYLHSTISVCCGIAHFKSQEITNFLLSDFEKMLKNKFLLEKRNIRDWFGEYIEIFTELKCKKARPLIYEALFSKYGYNRTIKSYPDEFIIKNSTQNNLNSSLLNSFYKYVKLFPNKTDLEFLKLIVKTDLDEGSYYSLKKDLNDIIQDMERKLTNQKK